MRTRPVLWPGKRGLNQIAKLFRGELVSFEVGDDSSLAVDDDGVSVQPSLL